MEDLLILEEIQLLRKLQARHAHRTAAAQPNAAPPRSASPQATSVHHPSHDASVASQHPYALASHPHEAYAAPPADAAQHETDLELDAGGDDDADDSVAPSTNLSMMNRL